MTRLIQPVQAPTLRSVERVQVADLVAAGILPLHPENVTVAVREIVLDPNVEDGGPTGALIFHIRMLGNINPKEATVLADYLAYLPADTPVKIEVGAFGLEDNVTFIEEYGFCVNKANGCDDE